MIEGDSDIASPTSDTEQVNEVNVKKSSKPKSALPVSVSTISPPPKTKVMVSPTRLFNVATSCESGFTFTVEKQEFHASKGFDDKPVCCPDCRSAKKQCMNCDDDRRGSRGGCGNGGRHIHLLQLR